MQQARDDRRLGTALFAQQLGHLHWVV
jgi:hypothetical protein